MAGSWTRLSVMSSRWPVHGIPDTQVLANIRKTIDNDKGALKQAIMNDSWETDSIVRLRERIAQSQALLEKYLARAQKERGLLDAEDALPTD